LMTMAIGGNTSRRRVKIPMKVPQNPFELVFDLSNYYFLV